MNTIFDQLFKSKKHLFSTNRKEKISIFKECDKLNFLKEATFFYDDKGIIDQIVFIINLKLTDNNSFSEYKEHRRPASYIKEYLSQRSSEIKTFSNFYYYINNNLLFELNEEKNKLTFKIFNNNSKKYKDYSEKPLLCKRETPLKKIVEVFLNPNITLNNEKEISSVYGKELITNDNIKNIKDIFNLYDDDNHHNIFIKNNEYIAHVIIEKKYISIKAHIIDNNEEFNEELKKLIIRHFSI